MKSVGEPRNEIAEHVACSWKAVQQKECGSVGATALPVEDFDAVDGYSPVSDLGHLLSWPCMVPSAQRSHPVDDGLSDFVRRIFLNEMDPRHLLLGQRWPPPDEVDEPFVGE